MFNKLFCLCLTLGVARYVSHLPQLIVFYPTSVLTWSVTLLAGAIWYMCVCVCGGGGGGGGGSLKQEEVTMKLFRRKCPQLLHQGMSRCAKSLVVVDSSIVACLAILQQLLLTFGENNLRKIRPSLLSI